MSMLLSQFLPLSPSPHPPVLTSICPSSLSLFLPHKYVHLDYFCILLHILTCVLKYYLIQSHCKSSHLCPGQSPHSPLYKFTSRIHLLILFLFPGMLVLLHTHATPFLMLNSSLCSHRVLYSTLPP